MATNRLTSWLGGAGGGDPGKESRPAPPLTRAECRELLRAHEDFVRLYFQPPAVSGAPDHDRTRINPMVIGVVWTGPGEPDALTSATLLIDSPAAKYPAYEAAGRAFAENRQMLRGVVMVAEAWAARYSAEEFAALKGNRPAPKDDPRRREVVVVAVMSRDFETVVSSAADVTRGPAGEAVPGKFEEAEAVVSDILGSFWKGYTRECVAFLPPTLRRAGNPAEQN